jgi:hypothetical protein
MLRSPNQSVSNEWVSDALNSLEWSCSIDADSFLKTRAYNHNQPKNNKNQSKLNYITKIENKNQENDFIGTKADD